MKMSVKEVPISDVVEINSNIEEFLEEGRPHRKEFFENRLDGKKNLKLAAYEGMEGLGYLIAYDRYGDGSIYCWMAAALKDQRRKGVLKALVAYLDEWAKSEGYRSIRVRTRNKRKVMLAYLLKSGFDILSMEEKGDVDDYRINLKKVL